MLLNDLSLLDRLPAASKSCGCASMSDDDLSKVTSGPVSQAPRTASTFRDGRQPRRALPCASKVAVAEAVTERVAFAEGFEFFNRLPDVGLWLRDRDGHQSSDGPAVLGDSEFFALGHPLKQL